MTYETLIDQAKTKINDNLLDEGIELLSRALDINPKGKEALYERGVLYTNLKQYELALFDFNKLIELEDNNLFYYACRAFIKTGMKDGEGAIQDYEMTLKLDPDDAIALNNLGLLHEQLNYQSDAKKSFQRSNEILGYDPEKHNANQKVSDHQVEDKSPGSRMEIIKSVFTQRSVFKEFIDFIKNGFKTRSND